MNISHSKVSNLYSIGITIFLVCFLTSCNLPAPLADTPTSQPTPSLSPSLTYTLLPPTDTPSPSDTPAPTSTPTMLFTVGVTFTSTSSPLPGILVRIRNNTIFDVNLYRFGLSGEIHFLGWLVPRYYGEFRFPDLGRWKIRYCMRDKDGESIRCWDKFINVNQSGQEFPVP